MRKVWKKYLLCIAALFFLLWHVETVGAADAYTYDKATNTYTVTAQSGDLTDVFADIMSEMKTSAAVRGTIVVKPGNYTVNQARINKSYVTISAKGATFSLSPDAGSSLSLFRLSDASTTGVTFVGGTYNGGNKVQWLINCNSAEYKTRNLTMKDCTLKNATSSNFRMINGEGVTLDGIVCENTLYGIDIKESRDVHITGSTVTNCRAGIDLRVVSGDSYIDDCDVTGSGLAGLQIKDKNTHVIVRNSKINNNSTGISMTRGATVKIYDSTICNNSSNGISPVGAKGVKTVLYATRSSFNGNGRHGIAADTYIELYVTDCVASSNAVNGILLNHSCNAFYIKNTTTSNNKGSGIFVENNSACKTITNCIANGNKVAGFALKDASTTITGCTTNENTKHGISAGGTKAAKISITDCESCYNKGSGINIGDKKTAVIKKTVTSHNKTDGVQTTGTNVKITGKGNVSNENGKNGYACRKGKMYISRAEASKNKLTGVMFLGADVSGYCVNSTLTFNDKGLTIQKGAVVSKVNQNKFKGNSHTALVVYTNAGSRKTTLKQMKKNTFEAPKGACVVNFMAKVKSPGRLSTVRSIDFSDKTKAGKRVVTGSAPAGSSVVVKADGKTYKTKASSKGVFSVRTKKLKKGMVITMQAKDKEGNLYTTKTEL